jgi:stearoyl-CoA desaturase (delta-9 desaturase)
MEVLMSTVPQKEQKKYRFVLYKGKNGTITPKVFSFALLQLSVLLVFTTYFSWTGVAICMISYAIRMFAITGFFHRYFAHRTYSMGRVMQFIAAFIGTTSAQKGPLWWAAHHRHHHKTSDTEEDPHNSHLGFWHSHMLWFLYRETEGRTHEAIPDMAQYSELRLLDKYWYVPPVMLGVGLFLVGGWHWTVWGMFVSTFFLSNCTYTINSLMHYWGKQTFRTGDQSRNHWLLALITFGEGWHNNHHRYQASTRNGFYWYEYDITYYVLKAMSLVGLVRDLKPVPEKILEEGRLNRELRQEARRVGQDYVPVKVVQRDPIPLGKVVAPRALDLRAELLSLGQQVDLVRDRLAEEMERLRGHVADKRDLLNQELHNLDGTVAEGVKRWRQELEILGEQVAAIHKHLAEEIEQLNAQVADKKQQLGQEMQLVVDRLAARSKRRRAEMLLLSEEIVGLAVEVGTDIQRLGEHIGERVRLLGAEIEEMGNLLPKMA